MHSILWKLIEKKFQDLGEFVEGKEKLKMVVHREYKNTHELHSMFQSDFDAFDDDDGGDEFAEDMAMMTELLSDEELEHDILSLGELEQKMAKEEDGDDEDPPVQDFDGDQKPISIEISPTKDKDSVGKSEEAAITLSSGDDSDEGKQGGNSSIYPSVASSANPTASTTASPLDAPLVGCRMFRIVFSGPSIGVDVCPFNGRIVVDAIGRERRKRLGPDSKPATGDVFASINGIQCPFGWSIQNFRHYMKHAFTKPPVTVVFAEIPHVREQFLAYREQEMEKEKERRAQPLDPSQVIEIADSDD